MTQSQETGGDTGLAANADTWNNPYMVKEVKQAQELPHASS